MSDEVKSYYKVIASYDVQLENLEEFVKDYKFKLDKYIVSVQRIDPTPHVCDIHEQPT